jgi:hypothetical protein
VETEMSVSTSAACASVGCGSVDGASAIVVRLALVLLYSLFIYGSVAICNC